MERSFSGAHARVHHSMDICENQRSITRLPFKFLSFLESAQKIISHLFSYFRFKHYISTLTRRFHKRKMFGKRTTWVPQKRGEEECSRMRQPGHQSPTLKTIRLQSPQRPSRVPNDKRFEVVRKFYQWNLNAHKPVAQFPTRTSFCSSCWIWPQCSFKSNGSE